MILCKWRACFRRRFGATTSSEAAARLEPVTSPSSSARGTRFLRLGFLLFPFFLALPLALFISFSFLVIFALAVAVSFAFSIALIISRLLLWSPWRINCVIRFYIRILEILSMVLYLQIKKRNNFKKIKRNVFTIARNNWFGDCAVISEVLLITVAPPVFVIAVRYFSSIPKCKFRTFITEVDKSYLLSSLEEYSAFRAGLVSKSVTRTSRWYKSSSCFCSLLSRSKISFSFPIRSAITIAFLRSQLACRKRNNSISSSRRFWFSAFSF